MSYVFNPENYGLTKVDKGGGTDDGFISDGQGNYYKLDNFKRVQRDDEDADEGDVFSSDLEKHARKYTDFDVTTYNTVNDVEKAVQMLSDLDDGKEEAVEKVFSDQSFEEAFNERNLSDNALQLMDFRKDFTQRRIDDIVALNKKKNFAEENNLGMWGGSDNLSNAFGSGTMSENARLNDAGEYELVTQADQQPQAIVFDPNKEKLALMGAIGTKALDHVIDKY